MIETINIKKVANKSDKTKERKYICAECGNSISSFMRDMTDYVYKIESQKNKCKENESTIRYFCCYSCYKKALKRDEQEKQLKEQNELLRKYNNSLTLKECQFCEDVKLTIEEKTGLYPRISIRSREAFKRFLINYYSYVDIVLKEEGGY